MDQERAGGRPVLRWAGGKSSILQEVVKLLPNSWNRYFEPMLGGAALFFHLEPRRAVLSDVNSDLISYYSVLKRNPCELIRRLKDLKASRSLYYQLRESRPHGAIQRAVRFAYLNRLAWNGLYRVNRNGDYNVPIGSRLPAVMWDYQVLDRASKALQSAQLSASDFRKSVGRAGAGDFVFLDPPYPKGSKDGVGFNRYSAEIFTSHDHEDLARFAQRLSDRGVLLMLMIADVRQLDEVYPRSFRRKRIRSNTLIACNGSGRKRVSELLLTNY